MSYKSDVLLERFTCYLTFFLYLCLMQSEEQGKRHQESQSTRLADLELLLNALAAKTEVCRADRLLSTEKTPWKIYI